MSRNQNSLASARPALRYSSLPLILILLVLLTPTRFMAQSGGSAEPLARGTDSAPLKSDQPFAALELARRSIEKYFEQATNVVCLESVTQSILDKNGKGIYREESSFEYQLQSAQSGTLHLVESRVARKASFRDPARTLLITNGFTSLLLIAHPDYEPSYSFESAGEEAIDGATQLKFIFKPILGGTSPAALQLRGRSYALPLSGSLWIDARSGLITKLVAQVDSSLADLGLKQMRSEIQYAAVSFRDPEETYWMPVAATIDVETPRQHWRNVHRFTNYRRFRATILVGTDSKP